MNTYYAAGIPYSDELWHHGTKGMKWGQRLYQYEDGSLTPLGKIHYANKKLGAHAIQTIKRRHTWMMSDEELEQDLRRLRKEKELKDAYQAVKGKSVSKRILEKTGDVVYGSAKKFGESLGENIGKNAASKIVDRLSESKKQKQARELKEEAELLDRTIQYRKSKQGLKNFNTDTEISRLEREKKKFDRTKEYLASKKALDDYRDSVSKTKEKEKDRNGSSKTDWNSVSASSASSSAKAVKAEKRTKKSDSYGTAKDVSSVINKNRVYGPNTWKSKKTAKEWSSKVDWGSVSASKASTSAKGVEAEKWTKKSGVLEPDYVYDSYSGYWKAKDGKIKGW